MLLDGHNFQHDSKVVFVEKAQGKAGGDLGVCAVSSQCSSVCMCARVCVSVCLPFSAVGETPGLLLPSQLLSSPRRQNILHSARVPHVVHINALYF